MNATPPVHLRGLPVLATALLLLEACDEPPPTPPPAPTVQNILVVTLDTVRADRVGSYGGPEGLTPNLDTLAAGGTRFERVSAPMPITGPSHASLFTGRYPMSHGLMDNFVSLTDEVETLAELLGEHGMRTGAFFHEFPFSESNVAQGFEKRQLDKDPEAYYVNPKFVEWLDEAPDQPFFAWVHYYIAHTPLEPPARFAERWVHQEVVLPPGNPMAIHKQVMLGQVPRPEGYGENFRQRYDAEVSFVDEKVGELLEAVQSRGLQENTLLVVVADHGESLGDDELGMHQFVISQETLEVPLFLRGPGVPAGQTVTELVEMVDLFPTILEPLELPLPEHVDGESLWPLVRRESVPWDGHAYATMPMQGEDLEREEGAEPPQLVVWSSRWKLVLTVEDESIVLYDLQADPEEQQDLADLHPEVVQGLRRSLEHWRKEMRSRALPPGELRDSAVEMVKSLGYVGGSADCP